MAQHWQRPSPPSRGIRLLVFAAIVVVIAVIAVSIIALLYTFPLSTPTPT
jgi:Tfp pilus assembly protein PilX